MVRTDPKTYGLRPRLWLLLKSKTYTSTRKNTFTLVTLPSFSISGVISTCIGGSISKTPFIFGFKTFLRGHVTCYTQLFAKN